MNATQSQHVTAITLQSIMHRMKTVDRTRMLNGQQMRRSEYQGIEAGNSVDHASVTFRFKDWLRCVAVDIPDLELACRSVRQTSYQMGTYAILHTCELSGHCQVIWEVMTGMQGMKKRY